MRKQLLILFALLLGLVTPMAAQKNFKVDPRVKLAKQKYTERASYVLTMKEYEKDGIPSLNYTTVVRKQNWSGSGQMIDSMTFYYQEEYVDDTEPYPSGYTLTIMCRAYNIGSGEYFEQYIYDDEGNPLLWYSHYGYFDGKGYINQFELQGCYAANGDLLEATCKKAEKGGELKDCELEETFEMAFDSAKKNFTLFKKVFNELYGVEYSY